MWPSLTSIYYNDDTFCLYLMLLGGLLLSPLMLLDKKTAKVRVDVDETR